MLPQVSHSGFLELIECNFEIQIMVMMLLHKKLQRSKNLPPQPPTTIISHVSGNADAAGPEQQGTHH